MSIYLTVPQDRFRPHRHQQSWRPSLQPQLPRRRPQQDQHKRLPRPRRYIPRVFPSLTSPQSLTDIRSVHAITARLNPIKSIPPPTPPGGIPSRAEPSSGLEVLETENFRMQCFNTLTGTKFLLFTDTTQTNVDVTIRKIYDLYADYVMKNPFYSLEMPIRCEMFERKLSSYIREINNR